MKSLFYLNKYLIKYKYRLVLGLLFIVISNCFNVYAPIFIKDIVNKVNESSSNPTFNRDTTIELIDSIMILAILYIVFALGKSLFLFLTRQTIIVASRHIEYDLKNEIYNQFQKLSLNYYKTQSTGDLMNRITEDVTKVRLYLGPGIMYPMNLLVLFSLTVFMMSSISVELTLYVLTPLPIMGVIIYFVSSQMNKQSESVQRKQSWLSTLVQENISGIRILKNYIVEDRKADQFTKASNDYKAESMKLVKINGLFIPSMLLLIGLSNILTIYIGGQMTSDPSSGVDAGAIVSFIVYVNMLTWPIASVGFITAIIQRAAASQSRLNEFLEKENDLKPNKNINPTFKNIIKFKDVSFTYSNSNHENISNINIDIPKGKTIAIYGKTGSGKSSITQLLMRMYDNQKGEIIADNNLIGDFNLEKWREQIAYVPQEVFLFSDTIANNIGFGIDHKPKREEIIKAAEFADVDKDIKRLKHGYDTILGERGINLSGGQKQRISIARAWLKKSKLLILDDSLSAVDSHTEQNILNSLKNNIESKTVVIITHRASVAYYSDYIYYMDSGKIIEHGSAKSLIKEEGEFYKIWKKQLSNIQN
jgi:ATP-binding cassette, subfamily B, multidrug efflux pump